MASTSGGKAAMMEQQSRQVPRSVTINGITHTRESLRKQRVQCERRAARSAEAYIREAIIKLHPRDLQHQKKTPMDLNSFRTSDALELPILHLFLQIANISSENKCAIIKFLHHVIANPNPNPNASMNPADGLDCALCSSNGLKAGEMFRDQAVVVLCMACGAGEVKVVKGMLAAATEINQCDETDHSPLMYASMAGHIDIIDTLIKHGAAAKLSNSKDKTSLLLACENKQWQAAIVLHQHMADDDPTSRHHTDAALLEAVKQHGVDYFQYAAAQEPRVLELLLTKVTLDDACKHGYDLFLTEYLTRHEPQPDVLRSAIITAAGYDQLCIIPAVLPHLDVNTITSLIEETFKLGHASFANELLTNACKQQYMLPCPDVSLAQACKARQLNLITFLLEHGRDADAVDDYFGFLVKFSDRADELNMLIKQNTTREALFDRLQKSLDPCNEVSIHPPLVFACMHGHSDVVQCLLQHGADTEVMSDETTLTAASKHGHRDVVDILLSHNSYPNVNQRNMHGKTPLQEALMHKHSLIAQQLRAHGANPHQTRPNVRQSLIARVLKLVLHFWTILWNKLLFKPTQPVGTQFKRIVFKPLPPVLDLKTYYSVAYVQDGKTYAYPELELDGVGQKHTDSMKLDAEQLQSFRVAMSEFIAENSLKTTAEVLERNFVKQQFLPDFVTSERVCRQLQSVIAEHITGIEDVDSEGVDGVAIIHQDKELLFNTGGSALNALRQACEDGSVNELEDLLLSDSDLIKGFHHDSSHACDHPLCAAIRNFRLDVIYALHKSGARLILARDSSTDVSKEDYPEVCRESLRQICSMKYQSSGCLPLFLPPMVRPGSLNDALPTACQFSNTSAARLLIGKSADVNYSDEFGMTPLHAAVRALSSELVDLLLLAGAEPNTTNREEKTPLYMACDLEHCEIASKLLSGKARHDLPPPFAPLLVACNRGYLDIVRLLLDNKADPNQTDAQGQHLLKVAHNNAQHEVVRLLLEYGAQPEVLTDIGLETACKLGYAETVHYMVHKSQIPRGVLEHGIATACQNGFPETALEIILECDSQEGLTKCFMIEGNYLITSGCGKGKDIRPDDVSQLPLLWQAFRNRDYESFRILIAEKYDVNVPNSAGRSLLQECIQIGFTSYIHCLCKQTVKLNINHRDADGRTALFDSLSSPLLLDGECLFDYLIARGADVNVRDVFGRSVLHEWQPINDGYWRGPALNDALRSHITSTDFKRHTALHAAVLADNITKVRLLLEHITDIDAHDITGKSALHLAVLMGNKSIARQLLEQGADPQARDTNGFSSVQLVKHKPSLADLFAEICPRIADQETSSMLNSDDENDTRTSVSLLEDTPQRFISFLWEVFQKKRKVSVVEYFIRRFEKPTYYIMQPSIESEMALFTETILHFMRDINLVIRKEAPVLSFSPRLSGSCVEGTKVLEMDEADILCVFEHPDWADFTPTPLTTNVPGDDEHRSFVQVSSDLLLDKYPSLFRGSVLSKKRLLTRLYSLIKQAIPAVLQNYDCLFLVDVKNALTNGHSLACMEMIWHGPVLPWQKFTFDIVPAIPVTQDRVPQAIQHPCIIRDLFVVPKVGTFDPSQNDGAFRLSFSSTERDLLLAMPDALRQGYMLTKVLIHECPILDSVKPSLCSYNFKTATFEYFKASVNDWQRMIIDRPCTSTSVAGTSGDDRAQASEVIAAARHILDIMLENIDQQKQRSFFIPECDLLAHSVDTSDHRTMLYLRYCKALLCQTDDMSWQQLTQCVVRHMNKMTFTTEVGTLLDMGLDLNKGFILSTMIKVGRVEDVRFILERGASVEDVDGSGSSALEAARYAQADDIHYFLEANIQVHLEVVSVLHLPFEADRRVGLQREGVIVAEKEGTYHKYQCKDGKRFTEIWSRCMPGGLPPSCYKYLREDGCIVLQDWADKSSPYPTHVYSEDGEQLLYTCHYEGILHGCVTPSATVMRLRDDQDVIEVQLRNKAGEVIRILKSDRWKGGISVCKDPVTGNMAVVDATQNYLDIFTAEDNHMALELPCRPNRRNSVCGSSEGVVVASMAPPALYLYTWSGLPRQTLTSDQLAIPTTYWIQAVQYEPRERVLQLAVGKNAYCVCALRVYRMHQKYSPATNKG